MSAPYDLNPYKLTLPVNKAGLLSGKAYEIQPPVPIDPWFTISDAGYLFVCPARGAVTATASNPRAELRDRREYSHEQEIVDRVKLKVLQCPLDAKVIVHQLHDKEEPLIKMVWNQKRYGGLFYALIKAKDGGPDTRVELLSEVKNTQSIVSYIEYDPNGLMIFKGNRVIKRLPVRRTGKGGLIYPKRGCYTQIKSDISLMASVLHC